MTELPLNNLRIIDLGRVWAGPLTTRILSDFGAEVIKVESLTSRGGASLSAGEDPVLEDYPDMNPGEKPWNRQGMFNDLNRNKKSLTLDLSKQESVDAFKKLVAVCDVVVENFTPRVMSNFRLDYAVLKSIKPDIIMLSMSAYGASGPDRDIPGFGNTIEAIAGITNLVGYENGPPHQLGMIAGDVIAALHGVSALMVALRQRRETGKGQHIDLSQAETQTSILGEYILDYQMNKSEPLRIGNHSPDHAPHGCYRCQGEDSWVVIDVSSEAEWQSLCRVMNTPTLSGDPKFSNQNARCGNRLELDAIISAWIRPRDHYDIMRLLQSAGVPCGAVLTGRELLDDPHLKERGFFVDIPHPDAGTYSYAVNPVRISGMKSAYRRAPLLGEHNQEILAGLLGMEENEISLLKSKGIIGNAPPAV